MTNEPKTTAERDYPPLPEPERESYRIWRGGCLFTADQMHAYYDLLRDKAKAWMRLADQRAIEVAELKIELGRLRALAASPTAQAAPASVAGPVQWDYDAALEAALRLPPKSSIFHEMLEQIGEDPTSGPVYRIRPQGRCLLDELQTAFFPKLTMTDEIRAFIEGMSVSVDVSTGDHDEGNRYFGTVTEVMDCPGDKHGVTLLVQDAEPNFASAPQPPVAAQEPFGYVNTHTGQFFKDVEACRRNNEGHWRTVYDHPAPQQAAPTSEQVGAQVVLADAARWLHAAYDRPPQTPECVAMLARIDAALATGGAAPVAEGDAAGLLAQHHRDSQELRRLCEARDEARRERDVARKNESAALDLLSRMRFACGDNGKRMQDELELYLRALQASHERYNYLTRAMGEYCVARADEYTGGVLKAGAADTAIDAARTQAKEGVA